MLNHLTTAQINGLLAKALKTYVRPQVLLLDELGYLPIDKRGADLLFQVVAARYESGSIVLTTNRTFRDWGALFDVDNTLATALIDRLMHHGEALVIKGDSYRMKDKIPPTHLGLTLRAPAAAEAVPRPVSLLSRVARGSPAHPRAARTPAGSSCGRSVRCGSKSQALVPCRRRLHESFARAPGPSWHGSRTSQTHPSAVVPIRSRPLNGRERLPTAPRHAASSHYSRQASLRIRPAPSCDTGSRPSAAIHLRRTKWLRLPAHNWLCFVERYHFW